MKRLFCALAALALLISAACLAEIPEPTEDFWVLDQAGVLSDATEGEIFFANQRLFDACGAEIVVVAVDTAGEMRLEDYCYALYNDWGISERGLLLVMAVDDEACYAMAGVAFDSVFSSGAIDQLFREALAADFNAGDYDAAARSFFEAAFARAADAMNVDVSAADGVADYNDFLKQNSNGAPASERGETAMRSPEPRSNGGNAMPVLIVVALILLCVLLGSMGWRRHYRGTFSAPPPRFGGFIFRPRRSPRPPRPPRLPRPPRPPRAPRPPRGGFFGGPRPRGGRPGGSGGFGGGFRRGGFGGARRSSGGGRTTRGGGAGFGGRR